MDITQEARFRGLAEVGQLAEIGELREVNSAQLAPPAPAPVMPSARNPPPPTPSNLAKLNANLLHAQQEIEAKQIELRQQEAEAHQLQVKLNLLNRDVDEAAERLRVAEEQFTGCQANLTRLQNVLLEAWANPKVTYAPDYSGYLSVNAAISDFPRIREHLTRNLAAAEAALREFEREHLS